MSSMIGSFTSGLSRAQVEAAIAAARNPIAQIKAGQRFNFATGYAGVVGTQALLANIQYCVPLGYLVGAVDQASIEVTAAAAASSVLRLALIAFADDPADIATVDVLTDASTVAVDSLGAKTWTLTASFDGTRHIGYLLWGNGTPSIRSHTSSRNLFGVGASTEVNNVGGLYKTTTYSAAALPATITTTDKLSVLPRVDFRVA